MEFSEEIVNRFLEFIEKERTLTAVCKEMKMNSYEALGLINYVKNFGINIAIKNTFDDISMINMKDVHFEEKNTYSFKTDDFNEFRFILLADTRLGSKSQQLSILNDIYLKGHNMGYNDVILCGNISAGLYPLTDIYAETNFANDTLSQLDYIVEHYPKISGMRTYFITGKTDDKHLKQNKINIGKRIAALREDLIYIGENSCDIVVDKSIMRLFSSKLGKTYTISYRTQQQIDSFRSEDKPDIMIYGGLLQMEKYTYRNVKCISVPSLCATTKEMSEKRYSNTIGAWYVTIKTNKNGKLENINALWSPYYITNKDDYLSAKALRIIEEDKTKVLKRK